MARVGCWIVGRQKIITTSCGEDLRGALDDVRADPHLRLIDIEKRRRLREYAGPDLIDRVEWVCLR